MQSVNKNKAQRFPKLINSHLLTTEYRENIKCRYGDIRLFLEKYLLILNLMAATCLKKVDGCSTSDALSVNLGFLPKKPKNNRLLQPR